ncbi:MAG: YebC/PmpR family DNA-binding transcriptional regulator [Candidatus Acetothermia bacterium]|jgi:YebC/PmpR family DNA-binding regulatory protein|nr:YebC/PmpR family DNA-binding transcriptional regulator [Candidatus Acetothermia bacterium]MDH7505626.1 YebC/PmpR family DNA-binding transcriptional regulator [Candidatus Acetothermia bacterium]
MAGHSKWANIKYRKEKQDQKRGAIFSKLAKEITLAARAGADPEKNAALANALARARAFNLPKENIERAIKRATGELPGIKYEEITYEGYGPGGVALLLRLVTDNRKRAAAEIRHIFEEFDGSLGESGSVAWLFSRRGLVGISREAVAGRDLEELLMSLIDLGAEDIQEKEEEIELYCQPEALSSVKAGLEELGIPAARAEVTMVPQSTVRLEGKEAERLLRFLERLDDQEDVQEVYANFDIPDEILEKVA